MDNREETSGSMKSAFGELIYCTECYAVVGETDECLCLVDRPEFVQSIMDRVVAAAASASAASESSGCGRTDRKCCGGGCGG